MGKTFHKHVSFFLVATGTLVGLGVLIIGLSRAWLWVGVAAFTGVLVGIIIGIFSKNLVPSVGGGVLGSLLAAIGAFHLFDYYNGPYGQIHAIVGFGIVGGVPGACLIAIFWKIAGRITQQRDQ